MWFPSFFLLLCSLFLGYLFCIHIYAHRNTRLLVVAAAPLTPQTNNLKQMAKQPVFLSSKGHSSIALLSANESFFVFLKFFFLWILFGEGRGCFLRRCGLFQCTTETERWLAECAFSWQLFLSQFVYASLSLDIGWNKQHSFIQHSISSTIDLLDERLRRRHHFWMYQQQQQQQQLVIVGIIVLGHFVIVLFLSVRNLKIIWNTGLDGFLCPRL